MKNNTLQLGESEQVETNSELRELIAPPMSSLGYANGWTETPAIVANCKHETETRNVGRCLTEHLCRVCNYRFSVDSGD